MGAHRLRAATGTGSEPSIGRRRIGQARTHIFPPGRVYLTDAPRRQSLQEISTPDADPRSDAELFAAARSGDDHAFAMLATRHARAALAVARGVVGDADAAEDVCQEALFSAWRRLDQCREPGRFGAWLASTVRRHALNALRGPRREPNDWHDVPSDQRGPDRLAEDADARARIEAALRQLSPEQRQAVLLFDLEGWSHAEIAALLETTEAMSRQHLMLGRRRMRQLLGGKEA